uniref:LITAF domain-containing protein n=1 Tax=Panagrellus redivivus TaxID=6233 RepID=A0A7E4VJ98_PANRE
MSAPSAPSAPAAPPPYEEEQTKRNEAPQESAMYPDVNGSTHQGPFMPSNTAAVVYQILPTTPTVAICPVCKETITTRVKYSNGTFTYVMTFLCGLFFLCCCIPLCCRGFKDVNHFCPKCKAFIGMNRRI